MYPRHARPCVKGRTGGAGDAGTGEHPSRGPRASTPGVRTPRPRRAMGWSAAASRSMRAPPPAARGIRPCAPVVHRGKYDVAPGGGWCRVAWRESNPRPSAPRPRSQGGTIRTCGLSLPKRALCWLSYTLGARRRRAGSLVLYPRSLVSRMTRRAPRRISRRRRHSPVRSPRARARAGPGGEARTTRAPDDGTGETRTRTLPVTGPVGPPLGAPLLSYGSSTRTSCPPPARRGGTPAMGVAFASCTSGTRPAGRRRSRRTSVKCW